MRTIVVHDTTLREGDQTPGIFMDYDSKMKIGEMLLDLGVDELEAGFPAANDVDFKVSRDLIGVSDKNRIVGFGRAVERDIDLVADAGCGKINIFVPSSIIQAKYLTPGKDLEDIVGMLEKSIDHAKNYGLDIEVSLSDATRGNRDWLGRLSTVASSLGVRRIVIADTVGCATPRIIRDIVSFIRSKVRCGIGVHLHNDLGMATGNALIAIEEGADEVQTTVGGIGERIGNTPLEELAGAQIASGEFRTNLMLRRVGPTVKNILRLVGFEIAPNKPIIGSNAFTHTTDLHIRSVLIDPSSFEAFDPKELGVDRKILVTHLIGRRSIKALLKMLGIDSSDEFVDRVFSEVKKHVRSIRRPLSLDEFKEFVLKMG